MHMFTVKFTPQKKKKVQFIKLNIKQTRQNRTKQKNKKANQQNKKTKWHIETL